MEDKSVKFLKNCIACQYEKKQQEIEAKVKKDEEEYKDIDWNEIDWY